MHRPIAAAFAVALLLATARAQTTIALTVDAREAPLHILHVRETINVSSGQLTLLYPQWIPGEHGPTGPIADLVGLEISGAGRVLPWRRDLKNPCAIHVEVRGGITSLEVAFDFILPPNAEGFSSGASSTARLLVLSWNQVVLYPQGPKPDDIQVTPRLRLPEGWEFATALTAADSSAEGTRFQPVSLTTLVDSPVSAGKYVRRVDLTPKGGVTSTLNIVADSEAALGISDKQVAGHRQLMTEALALFGGHHFPRYDFLLTLSDDIAHFGLEHHASSDNRLPERVLLDEDLWRRGSGLLPHEVVHSWNGKYRRPTGLATGDFSQPMQGDLLWVYEGLTEYLGNVLAARSGLRTPEEYRDNLARFAAVLDTRPGRTWRPLQDTCDNASILYESRGDWESLRRETDFYDEGDLLWLDVDTIIREQSRGQRSLDDFCRAFHGGASGKVEVKPYTFKDVVEGLHSVAAWDWDDFFSKRLQSLDAKAPLGGIERGGWTLVYTDTPSPMQKSIDTTRKRVDARFSIGCLIAEDGALQDVLPGSPAALAGLAPGMQIVAVDGRKWSRDVLRDALRLGVGKRESLALLAANGEFYATHQVDWNGGERYPHLQRAPDEERPDLLSAILEPVGRRD